MHSSPRSWPLLWLLPQPTLLRSVCWTSFVAIAVTLVVTWLLLVSPFVVAKSSSLAATILADTSLSVFWQNSSTSTIMDATAAALLSLFADAKCLSLPAALLSQFAVAKSLNQLAAILAPVLPVARRSRVSSESSSTSTTTAATAAVHLSQFAVAKWLSQLAAAKLLHPHAVAGSDPPRTPVRDHTGSPLAVTD
ncbi:MAG: hypothetical protein AAF664_19955 [Planctomycetota bacterium]